MNGYKAFYNNKSVEVYAENSFKAQLKAAKVMKVPDRKRYQIVVVLCEKDGEQITHVATE